MSNLAKQLNEYFQLQEKIYEYFGYREGWVIFPLVDFTHYYWWLDENETGGGHLFHAETPLTLELFNGGEFYHSEVYQQRFLEKWIYRTETHTLICENPKSDNNRFLSVYDNTKELVNPSAELIAAMQYWEKPFEFQDEK